MALTLTTSLSSTITKSELQDNFTSIQEKFNGGIDNSDIKAAAGIVASKLAASKEYCAITLRTGGDAQGFDVDNQYRDFVAFPGLSDTSSASFQNSWSLKSASWVCTDVGGGSGSFDVEWCEYNASGVFNLVSSLITDEVIDQAASAATNAGMCVIDNSAIHFNDTLGRFFALKTASIDANTLSVADAVDARNMLSVTLLLERDIQA